MTVQLPVTYRTFAGQILATWMENGKRQARYTGSALTANGRDLEAFERALDKLRAQKTA